MVTTIFPAVPKTFWRPVDSEMNWLAGTKQAEAWRTGREAGLVVRGPHIPLNSGLYGVEFQLSLETEQLPPDLQIAEAQVTASGGQQMLAQVPIHAGQLAQKFAGMYQGVRLDGVVEKPIEDVEFRLVSAGAVTFRVRGIKLIPRPGQTWFPTDLNYEPAMWKFQPDQSAACVQPAILSGPGLNLSPGDYRLGFKLKPPPGVMSGPVADLEVIGRPLVGETNPPQVIAANLAVTAEQLLAHQGIPDAKLRFRLEQAYTQVEFRVKALTPELTVQWIRLATADEAVWHHYYHLGGRDSVLGLPASGFTFMGSSLSGLRGASRSFQNGVIYWTIEHGPCEVYGAIDERYVTEGGPRGHLGFPTTRPQADSGEFMRQRFEGGVITIP